MSPETPGTRTSDYWRIVQDCLVEIHRMDRWAAAEMIFAYQARLNSRPDLFSVESVFHVEPFSLAWGLTHGGAAQNDLELYNQEYRQPYERILERHGWLVTQP